ncbi:SET domain-containing protein-lysine N-methyltransferase [Crossiella sp. NPDC003009]
MTSMIVATADGLGGVAFVPLAAIPEGAVVASITDRVEHTAPTKYTIQVSRDRHVDAAEVRYLNHSCRPNAVVDTVRNVVVATSPIAEGEQVTFFYPATEWEMADPFSCGCGHDNCLGEIAGAAFLPGAVLSGYRLSSHIAELVAERDR